MSGDIEISECTMCGNTTQVGRRYYHYNIKCDCCNGFHFEIVWYCKDCKPKPPITICAHLKPIDGNETI